MAGLLFALPTTQLTRRLEAAGRLAKDFDVQPEGVGDQCTAGLNFTPCRPRADILRDYLQVIETVYAPEAYFERVRRVGTRLDSSRRRFRPALGPQLKELKGFARMVWRLGVPRATRRPFWRAILGSLWANPRSVRYAGSLAALYLHFGPFSKYVAARIREAIAQEERSPSPVAPAPAPAPVKVAAPRPQPVAVAAG
jgi:hypothetical protein